MSKRVPALLALLALLATAAGAWVAFVHEPEVEGSSLAPLAVNPAPLSQADGQPGPPPAAPETSATEQPDDMSAATGVDVSLADVNAFDAGLERPPRAGLVFDVGSGEVLWSLHPRRTLSIASLTKIMTALLAVEGTRPREPVRITRAALNYSGSGVGMLPKNRRVQFETLLNGLLIVSGNDAAIALAVHLAGSEPAFVRRMNERAHEWGLECTRFASSHGLEAGNRSCARDLAVMTRLAMKRERIRRIARTEYADLPLAVKGGRLYLTGHNPLLRLDYPGAIGLKTGYTDEAGRCFVGVARRGGRTLGVVLLNSRDPSRHAPKLLDAAFAAGR